MIWHVDELKILHMDPDVVTGIIKKLNDTYGKLQELTATRGKIHEFLGTLDYNEKGKVKISMHKYVKDIIKEAQADFDETSPTPAANHLFDIETRSSNMQLLTAEKKEYFTTTPCTYYF